MECHERDGAVSIEQKTCGARALVCERDHLWILKGVKREVRLARLFDPNRIHSFSIVGVDGLQENRHARVCIETDRCVCTRESSSKYRGRDVVPARLRDEDVVQTVCEAEQDHGDRNGEE